MVAFSLFLRVFSEDDSLPATCGILLSWDGRGIGMDNVAIIATEHHGILVIETGTRKVLSA